MDLLDLYRGRLSWRKLAVHIKRLPREASIWDEMRTEAAELVAEEQGHADGPTLVLDDPLEALRYGPLEYLVHRFFNYFEASMASRMSEEDRREFRPTPPPGFKWADDQSPDMFDLKSAAAAAYFASMTPATSPSPLAASAEPG